MPAYLAQRWAQFKVCILPESDVKRQKITRLTSRSHMVCQITPGQLERSWHSASSTARTISSFKRWPQSSCVAVPHIIQDCHMMPLLGCSAVSPAGVCISTSQAGQCDGGRAPGTHCLVRTGWLNRPGESSVGCPKAQGGAADGPRV